MIKLAKIKRLHRRFFARHRFLLHVEAVLAWFLIIATFFYVISLFVIPSVVEAKLEKRYGGVVDVRFGRFKGIGAIRLSGVVIAEDNQSLLKAPILKADQIDVQFDLWKVLAGRFKIHTAILSDFLLTVDYDTSSKEWNLKKLSFQKTRLSNRKIPLFQIQQGTIRFRQKKKDTVKILATVGIHGQIATHVDKNEYSFMLQTDGRFGFGESEIQGSFLIGDRGEQSRLFATGQIIMPEAGILQNKWDMKDIQLEVAFDEKSIAVKQFEFSMGQGYGQVNGVVHQSENHPMKLNISLHGLTLSDEYYPDTICYHWLIEESDSGFAHFLKRFRPEGAGELDLSIDAELDKLSKARLDGLILCKEISVCDAKFPYRIEKMAGEIKFKDRTIQLDQIQALHKDVHLQLDGEISDPGSESTIDFYVTSQDMSFDEDLYQALPEKTKKIWYDYAPNGLAGVNYHYWQISEGKEGKELALELKDMAVTYKYFPYPLKNLTGEIIYRPQQLYINNVIGHSDSGGQVKVTGRILQQEGTEQVFDVDIQGQKISIDNELIQAMPETYAAFWRHFDLDHLKGFSDFDISVFPDKIDEQFLDFLAQIKIYGNAFCYDDFPLTLNNVELSASVTEKEVKLNSFEAQSHNGPVRVKEGRIWSQGTDPNQPGVYFTVDLDDFDLDETFWNSFGPSAQKKLGKFKLYGLVDAAGQFAVNAPKESHSTNNLVINCSDNSLMWKDSVLGKIDGNLHVADDRISFSELGVSEIALNALPKELISSKTEQILTGISPKGEIDVLIRDGFIVLGPKKPELIDIQAGVKTEGLSLGSTGAVSQLNGFCEGHLKIDYKTNSWQGLANYNIKQFMLYDRPVKDLVGELVFDPNAMQLNSDGFSAAICDGNITGNLKIDLIQNEVPQYQLGLDYNGVDVRQFSAVGTKESSEKISQGSAEGKLLLEGNLNDFTTSRGTLETKLVNLKMGQQSLLGKILTAVQFKQPENFVFNEIQIYATVLGPELIFDHIRMIGTPLMFYGTGKINLQNRKLEMELASWDRDLDKEETIFEALARGIGSALWKVEVGGTLDTPKVDAVYLSVLKQPLNIFKKSD